MTNYPPPPPPPPVSSSPPPSVAPGRYFDPASGLLLPEGTALASHGRRVGAFFLSIPLVIVTLVIGYVIWGAIAWGSGTSPALQVLGMRVYRPETGQRAHWGWMALRNIVGTFVQGILGVITQLISFVLFLSDRQRRTIPDRIAGTVILYDPNKRLA